MECNGCGKDVTDKDNLKCTLCLGVYHYLCLNINLNQFRTLTSVYLSSWLCLMCNSVTRRNKTNATTPVRAHQIPTSEDSMDSPRPFLHFISKISSRH